MYRQYFKSTINTDKLKEINRNAPEGVKYCNGLCQDFREKGEFSGVHVICNTCRNFMNLAENQINEKKITLEQLHENPDIVHGIDITIDTLKTCMTCKENKTMNHFDYKRNECKACRAIKSTERNNKGIDILISDIEKLKNNSNKLEKFVIDIPKDKLIKVISYFQIGRKATDTKSIMVNNVVEHFKKVMNPKLCRGGCGYELEEVFDTCEKCKNKDKTANTKMADFEENLSFLVNNLEKLEKSDEYKYTKEQLYKIAIQLRIKAKKKDNKTVLFNLINQKLGENKKQEQNDKQLEKNTSELIINGITIMARLEDGFVNATTLCKAGGKKFNDWYRLGNTKELIDAFNELQILETGNPDFKSIDIIKGKYAGSWIHPDLAIQLAQWVLPIFALQVSRWVREICITGTVVVGKEKNDKELIFALQKKCIMEENKNKELKEENKELNKKLKTILLKRQYYKLQKGTCFYILKTYGEYYKVGFEGENINKRLENYRTGIPDIKLVYLVYTYRAHLLEQNMLSRFETVKLEINHEVLVIKDRSLKELISSVNLFIDACNMKTHVCSVEDIEKYNES